MMRSRLAVIAFVLMLMCARAYAQAPASIGVGTSLPPLTGVDLKGDRVDLSGLLGKKALVISFWSIYCSDCVRELDDLKGMRAEFPPDQMEIVAVNVDSGLPLSRVSGFVKRYEEARGTSLNVLHLVDRDGSAVKALGVNMVPLVVTVDALGTVTAVLNGGEEGHDRARVAEIIKQGAVKVGAWSDTLRARLRSMLRETGPGGANYEWATFRVEDSQPLFGYHTATGWKADPLNAVTKEQEAKRVEKLVGDRLKLTLLRSAMETIGLPLADLTLTIFDQGGVTLPESPLEGDTLWRKLYQGLGFDSLYQAESRSSLWVRDVYHAGLLAAVDLDKLRTIAKSQGFEGPPARIALITVGDYDFKTKAVYDELKRVSYKLVTIAPDAALYYGTQDDLAEELGRIRLPGVTLYVETLDEGGGVRVEAF